MSSIPFCIWYYLLTRTFVPIIFPVKGCRNTNYWRGENKMDETKKQTDFEFYKNMMTDNLKMIEGDEFACRNEAAKTLARYLRSAIEVVDEDQHGRWPERSQKDAYIVVCTRAYMEAYREYTEEICK